MDYKELRKLKPGDLIIYDWESGGEFTLGEVSEIEWRSRDFQAVSLRVIKNTRNNVNLDLKTVRFCTTDRMRSVSIEEAMLIRIGGKL
jgi:hypothetical protein